MVMILTAIQILVKGLCYVGFPVERQRTVRYERNLERFNTHYGSNPQTYSALWEDLQTTELEEARLDVKVDEKILKYFFMTLHFLRAYGTEGQQAGTWKVGEDTVRHWQWYFIGKISALRALKICWPAHFGTQIFICSVDGIHFRCHEMKHPTLGQNPDLWDHKSNGPGLAYEIAVSTTEQKVIWTNGPFFPKRNTDSVIFRKPGGLREKIPDGKRGVADGGYAGNWDKLSLPNNGADHPQVQKMKSRIRLRGETFNQRITNFQILKRTFRHGLHKHQDVFFAVTVVCAYQLENGMELFDV